MHVYNAITVCMCIMLLQYACVYNAITVCMCIMLLQYACVYNAITVCMCMCIMLLQYACVYNAITVGIMLLQYAATDSLDENYCPWYRAKPRPSSSVGAGLVSSAASTGMWDIMYYDIFHYILFHAAQGVTGTR